MNISLNFGKGHCKVTFPVLGQNRSGCRIISGGDSYLSGFHLNNFPVFHLYESVSLTGEIGIVGNN